MIKDLMYQRENILRFHLGFHNFDVATAMVRGTAINPSIDTNLVWTQQWTCSTNLAKKEPNSVKWFPRHLLGEIWKIPILLIACSQSLSFGPPTNQPDVPCTGRCRWKDLRALWRRGAWTRANGTWPWENVDDNGDVRWENRDLMGLEWGLWKFGDLPSGYFTWLWTLDHCISMMITFT